MSFFPARSLHAAPIAFFFFFTSVTAQPLEPVLAQARAQKGPLLDTLKELVSIESGSRDLEGLERIAQLIAGRLKSLGGEVELVEPADLYRMDDTPERVGRMVRATFKGKGAKRILLIAHMDTVYPRGLLAKQPFRVDGERAFGLGIADDKQGIAVILHTVAMLRTLEFRDYGTLTVLVNADEELSSPGSRSLLTRLGAEHDATLSFEGSRVESDKIALATAGIASVALKVQGKASHAGAAPERGVNALYELSHQILQTRDLSNPATGLKMNWTVSRAGMSRNVIPPAAEAMADVRVLRVADYDGIEQAVRERIKKQLVPEAKVEMIFERRRPPLEASPASAAMAKHAQAVYRELGKDLVADAVAEGGGTDAAFAALKTKNAVVERFGLRGFGAHSTDDEYVLVSSIEPRLYLAARLVVDLARPRTPGPGGRQQDHRSTSRKAQEKKEGGALGAEAAAQRCRAHAAEARHGQGELRDAAGRQRACPGLHYPGRSRLRGVQALGPRRHPRRGRHGVQDKQGRALDPRELDPASGQGAEAASREVPRPRGPGDALSATLRRPDRDGGVATGVRDPLGGDP